MLNGNIAAVILGFIFLLSCAVDIRQVPGPRETQNNIYPIISKPVYIGKFEVFTAASVDYAKAWRYTFNSILKNNRVLSEMSVSNISQKLESETYIIDIEVYPKFESDFTMWKTWPAIWPLTGYWPLQVRNATYEVQILYTISSNGQVKINSTLTENGKKTIEIYGFFRTSEIESMIEVTNLKVLDRCAKEIINHLK